MNPDQRASRLLDEIEIQHLCDLDLLVFFARHPRTLLASEQLALFIGYDLQQIAESLEGLLRAGFLTRAAHSNHSARMYVFAPGGPRDETLSSLMGFVTTRDGRLAMKRALARRTAESLLAGESGRPAAAKPDVASGPTLVPRRKGGR